MEEYLIPNKYKGDGYGISVMFAGLNDEKYDYLKISIDGANYVEVERDTLNSYHSVPINFTGLESGVLYRACGKFSVNGIINDVECSILSQDGTDDAPGSSATLPSYIQGTYIDSVSIISPTIYSGKLYAGSTSTGYTEMLSTGLNVYDPNGSKKIAMGWTDGQFTSPYITLGIGTNETGDTAGLVKKFADGIWIGDATAKGNSSPSGTGFFIDITNDTFYKYVNGTATPFSACVFT